MCTSPTRQMRTSAHDSPKKTVCRPNASKNDAALITDETLPYHKEGADRAAHLGRLGGGPISGRSWAARCPELFAPGPARLRRRRRRHQSRPLCLLRSSCSTICAAYLVKIKPHDSSQRAMFASTCSVANLTLIRASCVKAGKLTHLQCP